MFRALLADHIVSGAEGFNALSRNAMIGLKSGFVDRKVGGNARMKSNSVVRFAGVVMGVVALHVGAASATPVTVLHSFGGGDDGASPYAGLIDVNGTLYGTTIDGGGSGCSDQRPPGCGTVFSITPSGNEAVLYSFGRSNPTDGIFPSGSLIEVNGTLYGTTPWGGTGTCNVVGTGCGTVFSVTLSGKETVLHSFAAYPTDGSGPQAGLINVKGTLYGTTGVGGAHGNGAVFSITPSGMEKVVYSFRGGSDGSVPEASLVDVNGTLYGTTFYGGGAGCAPAGCGTVFSLTPNGTEAVLYSFKGSSDGGGPSADLIDFRGSLFGTTGAGGSGDSGTVFSIDPNTGAETLLYSFKGGSDGATPFAGLTKTKSNLYGTTVYGGAGCPRHDGCGTVFSITSSGTETVLHRFECGQGRFANGRLINVDGTLYGTTSRGGGAGCPDAGADIDRGTVFAIKP